MVIISAFLRSDVSSAGVVGWTGWCRLPPSIRGSGAAQTANINSVTFQQSPVLSPEWSVAAWKKHCVLFCLLLAKLRMTLTFSFTTCF